MRQAGGIVLGLIVAGLTIALVEWIGHFIAPAPAGFSQLTPAELPEAIAALPLLNQILVPIGWFLGALGGAALAVGIAQRRSAGYVVAGLILTLVLFTVVAIRHPLWMAALGVLAPILAGWLAARIVPTSTDPAPAQDV